MRAAAFVAVAAAACGSFEDPSIILDLRAIAAVASPPEQVVDVDPMNPTAVSLAPFSLCAVVADPPRRQFTWSMTVCPPKRDGRCDEPNAPTVAATDLKIFAEDTVQTRACATVPGGVALVPVLRQTIEDDSLGGFGGVDLNASIRVAPVGADESEAIYLAKALRVSVRLPAERVANRNPAVSAVEVQLDQGAGLEAPFSLTFGPCTAGFVGNRVPPGATIKLTPQPTPDSLEDYVVPTFEGGSRSFTENLRYQWLATGGDWSRGDTGGPRDPAGNPAVISTQWTAPELDAGETRRDIDAWLVQRDERGGASWVSMCFAVTAP